MAADLKTVIYVSDKCVDGCMANCPYNIGVYREVCTKEVLRDALELLKGIPRICEECKNWTDRNSVGSPCWECIRKGDEPPSNWVWKYDKEVSL